MKKINQILLPSIIVLLTIAFACTTEHFWSFKNLMAITEHMAETGIMTLGMMMAILEGGIDLTVGSVCGLTSITIILLYKAGTPIVVAIILGLCTAILCGLINGTFIARFGVPPMLLTLTTSMLYTGISYVLCQGNAISGFPDNYLVIGGSEVLGIPTQTIIYAVLLIALSILLKATPWGLSIYAIGNNIVATEYCGINVRRIKCSAFVLSSLMAGIAGVIMSSRVATARLDLGASYQANSIAAAVLGGTSMAGGVGTPVGTMFGVAILSLLSNGMNHLGVTSFIQQFIMGITLVVVVVVNTDVLPLLASRAAGRE